MLNFRRTVSTTYKWMSYLSTFAINLALYGGSGYLVYLAMPSIFGLSQYFILSALMTAAAFVAAFLLITFLLHPVTSMIKMVLNPVLYVASVIISTVLYGLSAIFSPLISLFSSNEETHHQTSTVNDHSKPNHFHSVNSDKKSGYSTGRTQRHNGNHKYGCDYRLFGYTPPLVTSGDDEDQPRIPSHGSSF